MRNNRDGTKAVSSRLVVAFGILALLVAVSGLAGAQSTPHDTGFNTSYSCLSCHDLHLAPGPNLTRAATNSGLCQSCHNSTGDAKALPMPDSDMATPGVGGITKSASPNAASAISHAIRYSSSSASRPFRMRGETPSSANSARSSVVGRSSR